MANVTLRCWVYGEDVADSFTVDVLETSTVRFLKGVIRNETPDLFDGIQRRSLHLYATSTVPDDKLEDKLSNWTPEGAAALTSYRTMPDLKDHIIIIIVDEHSSGSRKPRAADPEMTLNCWVRGQDLESIFPVTIPRTDLVERLKGVIKSKKERYLRGIDASDLNIYRVSIAENEDGAFEEVLGLRTLSSLGLALRGSRRVSDAFRPFRRDDQLHLVVEGPVHFQCWFRGAGLANSFNVRVLMGVSVNVFKEAIKAAHSALNDTHVDRLMLYKIPTDDDEQLKEILDDLGSGELLEKDNFLKNVFGDVPLALAPRVVIETAVEKTSKSLRSAHRHLGNGDPIREARAAFLTYSTKAKPSSTSVPSAFQARQGDERKYIPCGRPRDREECIPTTLLHPAFGEFIDDCRSIEVTPDDNKFVDHLAEAMSDFYKNESDRVYAVDRVFQEHRFHFTVTETKPRGYRTDADISVNGHRCVIVEYKNEAGSTASEPYLQTIGYYLESTRESAVKFNRSPLPCLLLSMFGPYILFAGAAWNLRPVVQVLSMPIVLNFHPADTYSRLTVARHLAAFRKAVRTLGSYYENLQETPVPTSLPVPAPLHMFPYPTSYGHGESSRRFYYGEQPDCKRLVFFGIEDEGGVEICIKFVRSYSSEAHECLANLQCAPALRGFQAVGGGWYMVVMERLRGYEELGNRTELLRSSLFDDISKKLASFHGAKYVHGDIRDANIMVSEDGKRFMIVDFDWAGKVGEARYPPNVNYADIQRPRNARDGNVILEEDDAWMLNLIRSLKSEV